MGNTNAPTPDFGKVYSEAPRPVAVIVVEKNPSAQLLEDLRAAGHPCVGVSSKHLALLVYCWPIYIRVFGWLVKRAALELQSRANGLAIIGLSEGTALSAKAAEVIKATNLAVFFVPSDLDVGQILDELAAMRGKTN